MRPMPLVHHLLDHVIALPELKTDGLFLIFPAGVAQHPQFHLLPLSLCERPLNDANPGQAIAAWSSALQR
jgi:hypothetical protein